jgi:hypothetical protein
MMAIWLAKICSCLYVPIKNVRMLFLTDCKLMQSLEPLSRHEALAGCDSFFTLGYSCHLRIAPYLGWLWYLILHHIPSAVVAMLWKSTTDSQWNWKAVGTVVEGRLVASVKLLLYLIKVQLMTLSVASTVMRWMVLLVNNYSEGMWEETVVALFGLESQNLAADAEKNHYKP